MEVEIVTAVLVRSFQLQTCFHDPSTWCFEMHLSDLYMEKVSSSLKNEGLKPILYILLPLKVLVNSLRLPHKDINSNEDAMSQNLVQKKKPRKAWVVPASAHSPW